jgi:hypothetical protein
LTKVDYEFLLKKLGFAQVVRGKKLVHDSQPPTIYFNCSREGVVYFTAYRKDEACFIPRYWLRLLPMQKKDDVPELITVLPVPLREEDAFLDFLSRAAPHLQATNS